MKRKINGDLSLTLCNLASLISSYLRMDDISYITVKRLMTTEKHLETTRGDLQRHRPEDLRVTKMSRIPRACMAGDNRAHIYGFL